MDIFKFRYFFSFYLVLSELNVFSLPEKCTEIWYKLRHNLYLIIVKKKKNNYTLKVIIIIIFYFWRAFKMHILMEIKKTTAFQNMINTELPIQSSQLFTDKSGLEFYFHKKTIVNTRGVILDFDVNGSRLKIDFLYMTRYVVW